LRSPAVFLLFYQAMETVKMAVFWVVEPCSIVEVYRRFRVLAASIHRRDDGGKYLWNVGKLLPYFTALQPRRQLSSYSPPWEPEILQCSITVSLVLHVCLKYEKFVATLCYLDELLLQRVKVDGFFNVHCAHNLLIMKCFDAESVQ
jgi:hypothetical protein